MASGNSNIEMTDSITGAVIKTEGGVVHIGAITVNSKSHKKTNEFELPRLIETFRGRDQELNELKSLFFYQNAKKVVISGLPGMGKSELAKQFADQCKKANNVDYIFWIQAENLKESESAFKKLREQLQDLYQNLKEFRCLYIFDNTVSRKSIFELEPPSENYLLITSQVWDWQDDVQSLRLDHLTSDSAIKVFRVILNNSYNEKDCALYSEIAEIVNNIPLGLQVTAAYVRQRMKSMGEQFNLQQYVDEMKLNQNPYIDLTIPESVANPYTKSLYGAFKISIDLIKNEQNFQLRDLAVNALFVCAFLDPDEITFNDLLHMPNIKTLFKKYKKDENTLKESLSFIDNYSFINYDPNTNEIKIHGFVQEILRHYMRECDSEMQSVCYSACLEVLFHIYDDIFSINHNHLSIFKHADSNITSFYTFYKKYKKTIF